MIAEVLISHEIFPLKKSDTSETALLFMHDWKISDLPVVDNNKVLGFVSSNEICNLNKTEKIEKHIKSDKQFVVFYHQHIFEILKIFSETEVSALSVLNAENNFIGIISYKEIVHNLYHHSSLSQPGGIITLEMNSIDYSLAELSRIVEYNDIKIIDVFINTSSSNSILVSLKLNTAELNNILASLERHGKNVRSIHQANISNDGFSNRFDWLVKYLNT